VQNTKGWWIRNTFNGMTSWPTSGEPGDEEDQEVA